MAAYATVEAFKTQVHDVYRDEALPGVVSDDSDAAKDAFYQSGLDAAAFEIDAAFAAQGYDVPLDSATLFPDTTLKARFDAILERWNIVLACVDLIGFTDEDAKGQEAARIRKDLAAIASGDYKIPGLALAASATFAVVPTTGIGVDMETIATTLQASS